MRGFVRMMRVNLVTIRTTLCRLASRCTTHLHHWEARRAYFDQLCGRPLRRLRLFRSRFPQATPPSNGWERRFEISGKRQRSNNERVSTSSVPIFLGVHIPLLQGRIWDESETMHGSKLALINQTLAHQYFPNGNAVGSQIRVPN